MIEDYFQNKDTIMTVDLWSLYDVDVKTAPREVRDAVAFLCDNHFPSCNLDFYQPFLFSPQCEGNEHQISSHFFISICSPRGDLLCGGFFINQFVVDMNLSGRLAVLTGTLVDCDEFDQLQAHLTGQLGNFHISFQPADEFIGVCRIITDGLRLLLQRGDCFSERFLLT